MSSELIQARLSKANFDLADLDSKAQELELSRTDLIIQAVEMYLGFDNVLHQKIRKYAKGLKISEWMVIQNMLIDRFAREAAEMEVWGASQRLLAEFQYVNTNEGPKHLTGKDLFDVLKSVHIRDLEREKAEQRYNNPIEEALEESQHFQEPQDSEWTP